MTSQVRQCNLGDSNRLMIEEMRPRLMFKTTASDEFETITFLTGYFIKHAYKVYMAV
jgi:hypothetical protein